jgi:hypothetical protein
MVMVATVSHTFPLMHPMESHIINFFETYNKFVIQKGSTIDTILARSNLNKKPKTVNVLRNIIENMNIIEN